MWSVDRHDRPMGLFSGRYRGVASIRGRLAANPLHDEMDTIVFASNNWGHLIPDDKVSFVRRLRNLNAERAADESRGT